MSMISQQLAEAINAQVGREFGASMQYIQIAAFFDDKALTKTAELFFKQADEERDHAMKLLRYVLDAGGEVRIPAVEAPQTAFNTADEAVQLALNWELEVTKQINSLMEIALSENDYLARHFLDWFVEEQLEEVNKMEKLLKVVRSAGERNLYMMEAYITHLE